MRQSIIAAALLLFVGTAAQAAGVYRWVDKDGNVHYGDKAIENAEKVRQSTPSPAAGQRSDDPDQILVTEVRGKKCEQAKERLAQYQSADTLYTNDEAGNRKNLSPEEQVNAIVDMQKQVDAYCTEGSTE